MDGFELNKIAAAVLLAGVIALSVSMVTNAVYDPEPHEEVARGYEIEVAEIPAAGGLPAEEQIVQIAAFFDEADAAKGEKLTKACLACHNFQEGGAHKVGPNLYNIVGADIARHADYSYSSALAEFEGDWTYQALSQFLEKPKKYVKGTKMAYAGMKKPEDRADLLAYLKTLSANPVPYPAPPVTEEEKEEEATDDADTTVGEVVKGDDKAEEIIIPVTHDDESDAAGD